MDDFKEKFYAQFAPKDDRETPAYQLAVEYLYRTERFDRGLPHVMKGDTAWVDPEFKKESNHHAYQLMSLVDKVGKKKKVDSFIYKQYRSDLLRLSYAELEEEYKHYNGRYLLGGVFKWK